MGSNNEGKHAVGHQPVMRIVPAGKILRSVAAVSLASALVPVGAFAALNVTEEGQTPTTASSELPTGAGNGLEAPSTPLSGNLPNAPEGGSASDPEAPTVEAPQTTFVVGKAPIFNDGVVDYYADDVELTLEVAAMQLDVEHTTVNGKPRTWEAVDGCDGVWSTKVSFDKDSETDEDGALRLEVDVYDSAYNAYETGADPVTFGYGKDTVVVRTAAGEQKVAGSAFAIDSDVPAVTIERFAADGSKAGEFCNAPVTAKVTARAKSLSPEASLVDGRAVPWVEGADEPGTWTYETSVSDEGSHEVSVCAQTAHGRSAVASDSFVIDLTHPELSIAVAEQAGTTKHVVDGLDASSSTYYDGPVTATVTASDANLPASMPVVKDNGKVLSESQISWVRTGDSLEGTIVLSADGAHSLTASLADKAGNVSEAQYGAFVIDGIDPVVTGSINVLQSAFRFMPLGTAADRKAFIGSLGAATIKVVDANFDAAASSVDAGSAVMEDWKAGEEPGEYTRTVAYNGDSQDNVLSVKAADYAGRTTEYAFGQSGATFAKGGNVSEVPVGAFDSFTFDTQKPEVSIEVSGTKCVGDINEGKTDVFSTMPSVVLHVADVNLNLLDDATAVVVNGKRYAFKGAQQLQAVRNGSSYDIAIPAGELIYGDGSNSNTLSATFVDWAGNQVTYAYGEGLVEGCSTYVVQPSGGRVDLSGKGFIVDGAAPAVSIELDGGYVRSNAPEGGVDYFNKETVTAAIRVTDQNIDSAASQLSVVTDGVLGAWEKSGEADDNGDYTWTNTVTFGEGLNHGISVDATDAAGWETKYEYGSRQSSGAKGPIATESTTTWGEAGEGGSLSGSSFTVDVTKPVVSVELDGGYVRSSDGVDYFNAATKATVSVTDWNFNADDTNRTVAVDGQQRDLAWTKQPGADGLAPVWTAVIDYGEGQEHTLALHAQDWACNESDPYGYGAGDTTVNLADGQMASLAGKAFTVDTTAPEVTFAVDQVWKNKLQRDGQSTDYFSGIDVGSKQLVVTVSVKDRNFDPQTDAVEGLPVTAVNDEQGEKAVTWQKGPVSEDGNATWTCTVAYDEGDGHALSVKAVDWAGNAMDNVYGQHSTDASNPAHSLDASKFALDLTAPQVVRAGLGKASTNQYASGGNPGDDGYWFYGEQSVMNIEVADNIALEAVWLGNDGGSYYVANPESFQLGDKRATIQVALADGREFDRAIILHTRDMAKNERTWSISPTGAVRDVTGSDEANESLDKTNRYPQSVIQDTVSPRLAFSGVEGGAYYNTTQAVTLAINELNFRYLKSFDAAQQIVTVNKKEGNSGLAETSWSVPVAAIEAVNDGMDGLYSYTEAFESDGHYSLSAQVVDPALHVGTASQAEFTIDKTAPTVEVSFDNNDVRNGKYYNAARTATITVTEHNFDASLMTIDANGSASGWSDNGDVHTATVDFSTDGTYNLSVSGSDLAGNAMQTYTADEFVVDLTAPTVSFGGVDDKAAYNGDVMPLIFFSDEANFDASGTSYVVTGTKNGEVARAATEKNEGQSKEIDFADFDHDADVDDIYTIAATATDLAGNTSEAQSITFSVNRFGSNYRVVDSRAYQSNNGYLQQPRDVQVEEINVSGCEPEAHDVTVTSGVNVRNLARNDSPQSRGYSVAEATSGEASSNGWSLYTYTVSAGNFDVDGRYHVAVSSNDRATNRNTSSNYFDRGTKSEAQAEVSFILDTTTPVVTELNVERGGVYDAAQYDVSFKVVENIGLDKVVVSLDDGDEFSPEPDAFGNYRFTVGSKPFTPRSVSISAVDLAGRQGDTQVDGWRVTTDLIELHLPWVIVGCVLAVAVVAGVTYGVVRFRRGRTKDAEQGEADA